MATRASRSDVARLAGVSPSVVSFVVNNGPRPVAPATRTRVLEAIEQLGYRPNATARALRMSKSYVLGLMMWDITNPYYSEFAQIFQDLAYEAGYAVMIANTGQNGSKEVAEIRSLLDRQVDGIAAYGVRKQETVDLLVEARVRTVSMNWHLDEQTIPTIATDYDGATHLAVEHLRAHGHEHIGFIGGHDDPTQRYDAWRQMMLPMLGDEHTTLAAWGDFSNEGGYQAALTLLKTDHPPTALFVSSDVQAIGVLHAARTLGVRVPEDLAIVSVDGTATSAFTAPALSTVRVPFETMARECLRMLTDDEAVPTDHVTLPHRLLVRQSCGKHPGDLAP